MTDTATPCHGVLDMKDTLIQSINPGVAAQDDALSGEAGTQPERKAGKGARFWIVLFALLLSSFFAILEAVSISLVHCLPLL